MENLGLRNYSFLNFNKKKQVFDALIKFKIQFLI